MSERFKEYATGGAFHLSLSKRQAEMLSHIDQLGGSYGYLSTCSALESKGLIERIDIPGVDGPREHWYTHKIQLTEAGKAVIPLLKLAGVYMTLPETPPPEPIPEIQVTIKRKQPA